MGGGSVTYCAEKYPSTGVVASGYANRASDPTVVNAVPTASLS